MLLIATDEAGYGPKLGPLVVAATAWQIPDAAIEPFSDLFAPLREPVTVGDVTVGVDDSKAIFQASRENPLAGLHTAVSICNGWFEPAERQFCDFLATVAAQDHASIQSTPWLKHFADMPFLAPDVCGEAIANWSITGVKCRAVVARVITAKAFNDACDAGLNKADLLSQSTLGLVRDLVDRFPQQSVPIQVFCDRHGGRRYYGGVLQHIFDDGLLAVVSETKPQSVYRINSPRYTMHVHFTVKGDSFTPVAMSSIYAKYIRERLMYSLNEYFAARHQGTPDLKPTAGYPSDASRFLRDIEPTIQREKIRPHDLIRNR